MSSIRKKLQTASRTWVVTSIVLVALLLLSTSALTNQEPTLDALLADARSAFEQRHIEEQLIEALRLYETALELAPTSQTASQRASVAEILNRLSQLCYEATTFSPGNTDEDHLLFERGRSYGLERLRLSPGFAAAESDDFATAVSFVDDPAALLWTADNWGALCGMNPIEGLLQFGKVRTLYERCLEVEETYWGASAHNALGALLVVTPAALGGDPDAGIAHLETAVELAPDYLLNRVVRAQYWGFTYDFFGQIDGVRNAPFVEAELIAVLAQPIGDWPFWNREAWVEAEALLRTLEEMTQ